MANYDYGKEGDTSWWGIAAYAKLQVKPSWALVGRYEYLDDSDGGFMTIGQKAQTLTLTSDHLVAGGAEAAPRVPRRLHGGPVLHRRERQGEGLAARGPRRRRLHVRRKDLRVLP